MSFWKKLIGAKEPPKPQRASSKEVKTAGAQAHVPPAGGQSSPVPLNVLASLDKSVVDLLGKSLLGTENYDRLRKGVGTFPTNGEEVSSLGRETLLFALPAEKTQMTTRKAADVLLAQTALDKLNLLFSPGSVESKFTEKLKSAGLPLDVFSKHEISQLIEALNWFLDNSQQMPFKFMSGGAPILAPYSGELITASDKFRARTRMILAALEAGGQPTAVEVYVGYLADIWYGAPYRPSL